LGVRHDCVVATLHVFDSGGSVVVISWVGTGATSVIVVEAKAVCPAIVHVEPIVAYDGPHAGGWHLSIGHWS